MKHKQIEQGVVRKASFNRSLQDHDLIIGQKTAMALREYHERFVEPRLRRLEAPFWKRWWWRVFPPEDAA